MKRLSTTFILLMMAVAAVAVAPTSAAVAGEAPVYTGVFSDLAVSGYDPVSYFTDGKPVKGSKKFTIRYHGALWRFASQAHLDAFLADPEKYAPQYGGYCAWAVAQGYTASGDPKEWRIIGGKLYLNYSAKIKARWEKDIPGFIRSADANFPGLVDKPKE
ncbi:YHS domain-containing (seleno)protein [Kordiimonas marina]|uniref:YHS domain-containing (seleno)protein n=1 Tax=Kordiimonas marina TaxID=2872312 RepID=UPI001FF17158|nr:YHS domain-containing (seleno)protein [Kordiimonas marina]MCJ9427827.1 YHS domain-containing protein [Kordiimonas marina]